MAEGEKVVVRALGVCWTAAAMEAAVYELLQHVSAYVVHPGDSVAKFVEAPQSGQCSVALGGLQLLQQLFPYLYDEKKYLCEVIIKNCEVHQASIGVMCRVDFVAYVVLHAFHTLVRGVPLLPRGASLMDSFSSVNWGDDLPWTRNVNPTEVRESHWCRNLLGDFIKKLSVIVHPVDPQDLLAEVASSAGLVEVESSGGCDTPFGFLSSLLLREYLRRTYAYDSFSCGFEVAALAAECFVRVYPHLMLSSRRAGEPGKDVVTSLHGLVDRLLWRVSDDAGNRRVPHGRVGCVISGVAFVTTLHAGGAGRDSTLGTCSLSPFNALGTLLREDRHDGALLLVSRFPTVYEGENNPGIRHLLSVVRGAEEKLLVIAVEGKVCGEVLYYMETLGNCSRTVLVAAAVGRATMTQLALTFGTLPRTLESLKLSPVKCRLKMCALSSSSDGLRRRCGGVEPQSLLLSLAPLYTEASGNDSRVMRNIISVFLGGRCVVESALVECLFQRQLHHLINVLCAPTPHNAMIPAGGTSEGLAVSYLSYLTENFEDDGSSFGTFKIAVIKAVRDAINSYMECVLRKSGGLTADDAIAHLGASQERFQNVEWGSVDQSVRGCCVTVVPGHQEPHFGPLYRVTIPTPPLFSAFEASWPVSVSVKSNHLLADIREWEGRVEVASAYICIGRCLDTLCLSGVVGKRSNVGEGKNSEGASDFFFFPSIV